VVPAFWLSCHWYVKAVPVAVTEKLVLAFGQMVELVGLTVTTGAVLTVSVAAEEVAVGVQVPLTIQRYWYVLMPEVTPVRFKVAVVTVE
jgi:hypothetical protein